MLVSWTQLLCFSIQTDSVPPPPPWPCAFSPLLSSLAYLIDFSKQAKLFPASGCLHRLVSLLGMPFFLLKITIINNFRYPV